MIIRPDLINNDMNHTGLIHHARTINIDTVYEYADLTVRPLAGAYIFAKTNSYFVNYE